jgi:hypothetical protein
MQTIYAIHIDKLHPLQPTIKIKEDFNKFVCIQQCHNIQYLWIY